MLDAHPDIWGMGEDSVFFGHLKHFLPDLFETMSTDSEAADQLTQTSMIVSNYGQFVLQEMSDICYHTTGKRSNFIVDTRLNNFMNVGKQWGKAVCISHMLCLRNFSNVSLY